jgi:hypothetical protein
MAWSTWSVKETAMLTRSISWLLSVTCLPLIVMADDVAYRLDTNALTMTYTSAVIRTDSIQFQDRVWAVPGIEQATIELDPPQAFDFKRPARIRIERAPGCRDRFGHECAGGPDWLDDVALPRTREMYGLGQRSIYSGWDSSQLITFGGLTLQR